MTELALPGAPETSVNFPGKHKVFALGPDVTLPEASKSKLFALVNIRYLWEAGARLKTEGQTLVVTATFPVPVSDCNELKGRGPGARDGQGGPGGHVRPL